MPGRISEGHVHDSATPLRASPEQLAVGLQPPHDVLGQLCPVDPDDQLAAGRRIHQRRPPGQHVPLAGAITQLASVHAERVDADAGDVTEIADAGCGLSRPLRRGTPRSSRQTRRPSAGTGSRRGPRRECRPAPPCRRRRAASGSSRAEPTGCARSGRSAYRRALGQQPWRQAQVVVLDDGADRLAISPQAARGCARECSREHLVIGAECLPVTREAWPEARLVGRVVEHVVHEPQRGVRDRVIGPVEDRLWDVQHAHGCAGPGIGRVEQAIRRKACRRPVVVAQRRANPEHVGLVGHRGQAGHHPATAALGRQAAIIASRERDRPPVGRDEYWPVALRFAHVLRA